MPFWESADLDETFPPAASTKSHPMILGGTRDVGDAAVIPEMFLGDVIRRCFSPTCRGHILVFVFLNFYDWTEGVKRMLSGVGRAHVPLALARNEEQQTINKFSVGDNVVLTACLWLIFCAINTARSQGWVRWPPHWCGAGWQGVL